MRKREEIEEIEQQCSAYQIERLNLEVLLDIRDLLVEQNKPTINTFVAGRTLCGKIYPSGQKGCSAGSCKKCNTY